MPRSSESTDDGAIADISIVCAGNWYIAHDRIGPRVLELLGGSFETDVEICDAGTAGLAVLDFLRGQPLVLVVDAALFGGYPGEVRVIEPDLRAEPSGVASVHQMGPLDALWIARKLYPEQVPRDIRVVVVETEGIDEPGLETACQEVVAVLVREIATWRQQYAREDAGGRSIGSDARASFWSAGSR